MRRILPIVIWQFGLLAANQLLADVVTMKDGRQISGLVESGNLQALHIKLGDQSQTLEIDGVQAIQFGVSLPAASATPAPSKAPDAAPDADAPPNHLFLSDGKQVAGKWWSLDATNMHFLVNKQLQDYPRQSVSGVTFGVAALPPLPARPAPPSPAAPAPAVTTPPAHAPSLQRPTAAPPSAERGLSQPEEIGTVYFWNGKVLLPLETTQAAEHKNRSTEYWEIPAPQSRVRLNEAPSLIFILRLPKGVNPAGYALFSLTTVNGARRTRMLPGRKGVIATWPVDIAINDDSSLMTYALTVRDLPAGEYSFSPSSSNDGFCFGVDASPGQ